jgi:hypothetical protein
LGQPRAAAAVAAQAAWLAATPVATLAAALVALPGAAPAEPPAAARVALPGAALAESQAAARVARPEVVQAASPAGAVALRADGGAARLDASYGCRRPRGTVNPRSSSHFPSPKRRVPCAPLPD